MRCGYIYISQLEFEQAGFIFSISGEDIFPNVKMAGHVYFPMERLHPGDSFYISYHVTHMAAGPVRLV